MLLKVASIITGSGASAKIILSFVLQMQFVLISLASYHVKLQAESETVGVVRRGGRRSFPCCQNSSDPSAQSAGPPHPSLSALYLNSLFLTCFLRLGSASARFRMSNWRSSVSFPPQFSVMSSCPGPGTLILSISCGNAALAVLYLLASAHDHLFLIRRQVQVLASNPHAVLGAPYQQLGLSFCAALRSACSVGFAR